MLTIPTWLQSAFADWISWRIYVDRRGNYRSRSRVGRRRIVPFNRPLKRLYPDNRDFHRAADRWLALWDAVPTARLTRADRIGRTERQS